MKAKSKIVTLFVLLALLVGVMPIHSAVFANTNQQQVQFSSPVAIVNTSFLNVRTGPGIQYATLVTVVGGTALPVLGIARDRVWYQVSTVVGVGWVNSQYVLPRGDFTNVPFAEAPAIVNPLAVPSGSPAIPGTGGMGGMGDDTAVDMGFSSQREWGVSVVADQPLRSGPTINSAEITFLPVDMSVIYTVTGATFAEGIQWIQVNTGQFTGWLEGPKVTFRPFACTMSAVLVTQDVPLRSGPDGTGADGATVAGGQEAYLLDRVGELYKIELINGVVGWLEGSFILVRQAEDVRSDYCASGGATARAAQPGTGGTGGTGAIPGTGGMGTTPGVALGSVPRVIINTGFLNVRSGPGAQFTAVATLPGGTELAVLGIAPDGVWYLVQGTFGQGWLNSEFTLFRGDGSRLPIIRNAVGVVAVPTASLTRPSVTLYAAPNLTLGVVGTLTNSTGLEVVARTSDFTWVQLRTPLGFGWVQLEFVTIQGDTGLIPVVGG